MSDTEEKNMSSMPDSSSDMSEYYNEEEGVCEYPEEEQSYFTPDPSYNDPSEPNSSEPPPNMSYADGSVGHGGYYDDEAQQCTYEYGGGPAANSSFYSDLMSQPEAGQSGPSQSLISEHSLDPNLVLELQDEILDTDAPYISLTAVDSDGVQNQDTLHVTEGKPGYLYWNASNATEVYLNGDPVDLRGSKQINFDPQHQDNYWPYELVAYNGSVGSSTSRYVLAYMTSETSRVHSFAFTYKLSDYFDRNPIEKEKWTKKFKYFKVTPTIELQFQGKWIFHEGKIDVNSGWSRGIAVEAAKKFKLELGEVEVKLNFKQPFKVDNSQDKEQAGLVVEGSISYTVNMELIHERSKGFGELTVTLIKMERPRTVEGKWGPKAVEANLSFGGSIETENFETDKGKFAGSIGVKIGADIVPNWSEIAAELVKRYGPNYGLTIAGNIARIVGAAAASPGVIIAGGAATITIGTMKWMEATELGRFARDIVPDMKKQLRAGFTEGIYGRQHRTETVSVIDGDTAFQAGVAAGSMVRLSLEERGEPFSAMSSASQQEIIAGTAAQATANMQLQLWIAKAKPLTDGTYLDTDWGDLRMQQYWWTAIIGGDSPSSRGGHWLDAWETHRVKVGGLTEYIKEKSLYRGSW